MGCIQSLAALSAAYPPSTFYEAYGCDTHANCGLLEVSVALMINSNLMLDLSTHQALLTLATHIFAGNHYPIILINSIFLIFQKKKHKKIKYLLYRAIDSRCFSIRFIC